MTRLKILATAIVASVLLASLAGVASAWEPGDPAFERTWERFDRPVADGSVARTWMWGPQATTGTLTEPYADAPGGSRVVQYFDKARMEITHPEGDPTSPWHVTNGLLVVELATGRLQLGDASFEQREPSEMVVAGDPDGGSPTYALLGQLMDEPAYANGETIIKRLAPDGTITDDPWFNALDMTAYYYVPETKHQVAEPFWYFLTSEQPVYEDGQLVSERLFQDPFYATGLPITEAYWVHTTLAGNETDILVQAFERRVLTYTPTNQAGWQVESGNVGTHYYAWRYGAQPHENVVVASIPTGPDTIEYYRKGNPQLGEQDWGPQAMSVAPDGTFWMADSVATRVVQFSQDGQKIGEISLVDQYARSIWDLEARTGLIWIFWDNPVFGLYKIQAYQPDGALIHDVDLDPAIIDDALNTGRNIAVTDNNEVIMQLDLGFRYVRVVTSDGQADATPVDSMVFSGHHYQLVDDAGDFTKKSVILDGHEIALSADEGAFALDLILLPDPVGDSFFITRYSIFGNGSFHWDVEHRAVDGTLIGAGSVPEEDNRYVWLEHPYSVGPDGNLYKLTLYRYHMEITRVGFAAP